MKCPKCRYLSFEPELRCKHCGYDFSLANPGQPLSAFDELEQQDPDMPLVDLQLRSTDLDVRSAPPLGRRRPRQEPAPAPASALARRQALAAVALAEPFDREPAPRIAARPEPMPMPAAAVIRPPATPTDLPLFIKRGVTSGIDIDIDKEPIDHVVLGRGPMDDDKEEAAVHVPAAPRPLVVRRKAPELWNVETESPSVSRLVAPRVVQPRPAPQPVVPTSSLGEVDAPARLKAAGVDLGLLLALNVTVILLTLRQCDLTLSQIASVPVAPLVGFLATITVGYLLLFNVVSMRTIGKMIFGLHVVAESPDGQADLAPTPKQLSYRALLTVPSVLLLGLGFLPGLVGEGLAIHDRLTHTRVVRE